MEGGEGRVPLRRWIGGAGLASMEGGGRMEGLDKGGWMDGGA